MTLNQCSLCGLGNVLSTSVHTPPCLISGFATSCEISPLPPRSNPPPVPHAHTGKKERTGKKDGKKGKELLLPARGFARASALPRAGFDLR